MQLRQEFNEFLFVFCHKYILKFTVCFSRHNFSAYVLHASEIYLKMEIKHIYLTNSFFMKLRILSKNFTITKETLYLTN